MSIGKVRDYFKNYGMEDRILELDGSSATVELAAEALNCQPERIGKSLSFIVNNRPIIIVVAGDAKIDNKKYRKQFSAKAKMIKGESVLELIGHDIGGVCPFAVNEGVEIYLDESLKRFESVYPACGTSSSAIELTIEELEKHSKYTCWVDVCKGWK